MLETTRIRKEGYAVRPTFEDFVQRYQMLTFAWNIGQNASGATCRAVLERAKLTNWQIGKTKVRVLSCRFFYIDCRHNAHAGVPSLLPLG